MKKGFSLIELIATMGVIAIVAGFGMRSSMRGTEQKKISEAAETLRQQYMQTKSMALSGRKDCAACGSSDGVCGNGDTPLLGWRITINTGADPVVYEIHGECGDIASPTTFFSSGTKTLPTSIGVAITNAGSNVLFYPLSGGVNMVSDALISVSSDVTGLTSRSFTVTRRGEITAVQ